jgi:5-methyltetrahydropteroyltriglutamate--homocysteine methyltransferase
MGNAEKTGTTPDFTTTVTGSARVGRNRELKKATEAYWAGTIDQQSLLDTAATLRRENWSGLLRAGLDSIPVNTFSFYDQMLDTAVLLGCLPPRFDGIADDLDRYFAAARGSDTVPPLEMTKWFDTNYHYLVPEISDATTFSLHPEKVLGEIAEAVALGMPARPVVIGPITFLRLAKAVDGAGSSAARGNLTDPIGRVDELIGLYIDLLTKLAQAGAAWVQLDEPALVTDLDEETLRAVTRAYKALAADYERPAILVSSYFGDLGPALPVLAGTPVEAVGIDLVYGDGDAVAGVPELASKLLVAGVVDGRNIWRADLDAALAKLGTLLGSARAVAVSTSCSTLHVPYSLGAESGLDDNLRGWLAFADEKVDEVVTLSRALRHGRDTVSAEFAEARAALATRATDPRLHNDELRARLAELGDDAATRGDAEARRAAQRERLGLPVLPTTTIGSYPQTVEIRRARAELRSGKIDGEGYRQRMRDEIAAVIKLQEELDIDVLVHGEPERNDMVQYFAEQLDGFFATQNGWVQSYGTRCVRPPILFGDVTRPHPMTVEWISYAQSLTGRPVKGMLTGPVTILAWSFVRDDQPLADSADQVALAIRDETVDLESAGTTIIQVDEPALRELLPLRDADKAAYLEWAVHAFRLSTSGIADSTQIHTHLCYSEFGEVINAIADLDADVTSIEAARSAMEVLDDLNGIGFSNEVGPGVYDIHSPRVPSIDEIATSLRRAHKAVPAQRLWVNPDCGLKTRKTDEVTAALGNLVAAAKQVRDELA